MKFSICDFEVAKGKPCLWASLPNSLHLRWFNCSFQGRNDRTQSVAPEFHEAGETHPALQLCKPQQSSPGHGQKLQAPKSNFARSLRVTGHSKCLSRLRNKRFWKASLSVQFQNSNQTFIASVQLFVGTLKEVHRSSLYRLFTQTSNQHGNSLR